MRNSMKGGYRGNNFDPAKSAKCQALIAHLQNGGGVPNYGGSATAHAAVPPPPAGQGGMFASGQGGMFAFHVGVQGDISDSDTTPQRSPKPFVPLHYEILMENQAVRVADRLLRAANQVHDLETLIQGQEMNPLPFEEYIQIRDEYLDDIDRTMSGTARGDPPMPAEVHMLDLNMQNDILTENSSWDLLAAAGMVDLTTTTPAPPASELPEPSFDIIPTPTPADDSSKYQDSSDFELYGEKESESSADEEEEREHNDHNIFGSSSDDDDEQWWTKPIGTITPSYSPHGYSQQTEPGTPEKVTSSVSEYNSEEEED
jgi:hypothetical protein